MSNDGSLIENNMDLSHIHLAIYIYLKINTQIIGKFFLMNVCRWPLIIDLTDYFLKCQYMFKKIFSDVNKSDT